MKPGRRLVTAAPTPCASPNPGGSPTMSTDQMLPLEQFDTDGALQETGGALDAGTRAAFFKKAGLATVSLAGTGALMGGLPSLAMAAKGLPKSDVAILNFAL